MSLMFSACFLYAIAMVRRVVVWCGSVADRVGGGGGDGSGVWSARVYTQ